MVQGKKAEDVICTLTAGAKYLVIVLAIGWLGIAALDLVNTVSRFNTAIINETISAAKADPNQGVMAYGNYFARNQGCYFTGESSAGDLITDTPVPTSKMMATIQDVRVDGSHYTFFATNSGTDLAILFTVVMYAATSLILLSHMNNVINANETVKLRFEILKSSMSEDEQEEISILMGGKPFKKLFNYKLCTVIPIVSTIASIVITLMSISDYGLMITNRISSAVQHYGVIQSEQTIANFNEMDGVSVYIIETTHQPNGTKIENTTVTFESQDEVGVGYVTSGFMARNYKMLTNGKVLCVSLDLKPFHCLVAAHIAVFALYMIYLWFRAKENRNIQVV